jgi:hypothetical protein
VTTPDPTATAPEALDAIATLASRVSGVPAAGPIWLPRLVAPPAGWLPGTALVHPEEPALSRAVASYAAERGTDHRVAATLLWKAYAYWAALPAVVGWAAYRRVPDLALERMAVRFPGEAPYLALGLADARVAVLPGDPIAGRPGTLTVQDEDALLAFVRDRVVEGHLHPLLTSLRGRAGVGSRLLWGSVAVAFSHPFTALTDLLDRDPRPDLHRLLATLGRPARLVEIAEVEDAAGARRPRPLRRTCCLAMRVPGGEYCLTCPLLPEERRDEESAAYGLRWLRSGPAAGTGLLSRAHAGPGRGPDPAR